MTLFVTLLLTVVTFAFVSYPLFKQKAPLKDSDENDGSRELHSKRDTTYSMLKELEFDYQSGILSEEDYKELESRYKSKAISILKDLDSLDNAGQATKKTTRKFARKAAAGVDDEIERQVMALRQRKGKFCTQCGAQSQANDRFCSQCGASLAPGGSS